MISSSLHSAAVDNVTTDFRVLRWSLEWWIFPDCKILPDIVSRIDLLVPTSLPVGTPPVKWDYLGWEDTTQLMAFRLAPLFQEELKISLRKQAHVKGNAKGLFFLHRENSLPFEAFVIAYPDHTVALYFRTPLLSNPLSTPEFVSLSSLPSQVNSLLRKAVDKICTVLGTGEIKSRPTQTYNNCYYPYIHILDYSPKSCDVDIFPWHELAQIGTRHLEISPSDQNFVGTYKAKNHSLRNGVLVVDKQSTLVVSPQNYLELQGIRYCLFVALRMRCLLEQQFRDTSETSSVDKGLLERLRYVCERPSVITNSHNYQMLWPLIAGECQVIQWMTNIEKKPTRGPAVSFSEPVLKMSLPSAATEVEIPESLRHTGTQYKFPADCIRLLHLSDLHFTGAVSAENKLQWLEDDLKKDSTLSIEILDYVVISGDLTNKGGLEGFVQAKIFIELLCERFAVRRERCMIVPGNHDLYDHDGAYQYKVKLPPGIPENYSLKEGSGFLVRNEEEYLLRLEPFSSKLYRPLFDHDYPKVFVEQGMVKSFPDDGLQFVLLNSAWEVDQHHRKRSSIHPGALTRAIQEMDKQFLDAAFDRNKILRIGFWHHAIQGPAQMANTDFVAHLQKNRVRLALHGDIHKLHRDCVRNWHKPSRLHVVGAGSFASPAEGREESVPRLYNLLEISRDLKLIRVHTRAQKQVDGVWEGWNEWPCSEDPDSLARYPYFDLNL